MFGRVLNAPLYAVYKQECTDQVKDHLQILHLWVNLDELINFYSPWNHPETWLMVFGGIEITLIHLNSHHTKRKIWRWFLKDRICDYFMLWLLFMQQSRTPTKPVFSQMTQLGRQDTLWNIKSF